jgi:hypothetical protein
MVEVAQRMAKDIGETEFMKEQDQEVALKYNLKKLKEQSNEVNEVFDGLKTPRAG